MSNLKHKDAGDQEVLGQSEKPALSTAEGRQVRTVMTELTGKQVVVVARNTFAEAVKTTEVPISQDLAEVEVDNRPIKDYGYEVKQHGQDKVIETGVQYQVEKLLEN